MPSHKLLNKSYYTQRERTQEPQTGSSPEWGIKSVFNLTWNLVEGKSTPNLAPTNPQDQSAAGQPWDGRWKGGGSPCGGIPSEGFWA